MYCAGSSVNNPLVSNQCTTIVWWLERLASWVIVESYIITKSEPEIVLIKHDSCSSNTTATETVVAQTQLFIQMLHSNGWLLLLPSTRHHSNHTPQTANRDVHNSMQKLKFRKNGLYIIIFFISKLHDQETPAKLQKSVISQAEGVN